MLAELSAALCRGFAAFPTEAHTCGFLYKQLKSRLTAMMHAGSDWW
jgi:hypothetical protein